MTGMRVYLECCGAPARERLGSLVDEAKAANDLAPVTVVPPSPYAGMSLRRILAGKKGLFNVRFLMSDGLAEHLGAPAMAGREKRPLPPLVEMSAVRAVVRETVEQGILGDVSHHPSLHRSLRSVFRELIHLKDEELDLLAGFGPLQEETVRLFRWFGEKTCGYYHGEEMAVAAAKSVSSPKPPAVLRDIGSVIYYLPANLSPAQQSLARALATVGQCSLILGLIGDDEVDRATLTLANSFASISPRQAEGPCGADSVPDASVLAERMGGKGPLADGVVSAPDTREEVRRVVRDILAEARKGVPFHQLAVLYRQPSPYAHQLSLEFRLAGIPIAGPCPTSLKESAAGRLLLGLLAVMEDDFGRSRLMQWVAESPVRNGSAGAVASDELVRWERISRRSGVVGGLGQWLGRVSRHADRVRREMASLDAREEERLVSAKEEEVASAGRLVNFLRGLRANRAVSGSRRWSEFGKWGKDILRDYATDSKCWPEQERAARERVEEILGRLPELDSMEPAPTLSSFRNVLEEALDVVVGQSGPTGSGVFVAGLGAAVGMEFEAVWIVGMADGAFPPRASEDQFLPDGVRRSLGEGRLPLRSVAALEELRVYLSALSAGRRRYLSYARTDPVALREQRPAPWLLDAVSLLHGGGETGRRVSSRELTGPSDPWLSVIHSPEDALRDASVGGAVDLHEYDLAALAWWRREGGSLDQHPLASVGLPLCRALGMERARGTDELTEWDGHIGAMALESERLSGALTRVLSPTRLESWAECPFRFFLGSVLSVGALETPEELLSISPMDRGKLVHVILERFVKESLSAVPFLPTEARGAGGSGRIMAIAEEEFGKVEERGLAGQRVMWEAVKEEIRQDLETFLERDAEWRAERGVHPRHVEFPFGFEGPPVTLGLPDGGRISFRGVIDRVDLDRDRLRAVVIDYKTGSTYAYRDMKKDPLGRGTHLQLPIYALAVRDALGGILRPHASVVAEYWFVSAKGRFQREKIQLDDVEANFRAAVQTIVQGIRGGVFPADPGRSTQFGSANCSSCDFDRLCPVDRQKLWERKRSSPRARAYIKLSEVGAVVSGSGDGT